MDASSNPAQENGSNKPADAVSQQQKFRFNVFDLVKVGLSSTIAISILIGVGHVVKHVAGPSAILSILIAAFIAYFVGGFYLELNTTIVRSAIKVPVQLKRVILSSGEPGPIVDVVHHEISNDWLLPSYELLYIFNGELAAFVMAWNLIMEYMVIVALISKALIIFIDALFFGYVGHLSEFIPMSWYLSQHFDLLALLVPIVIGVPLMLLLRRNTIFNSISIALALLIVVIFLFFGIFNADISNWRREPESMNPSGNGTHITGGFYAFGIDGVFNGVVIILFMFIGFDAMVMSRWTDFVWFSTQHSANAQATIKQFGRTMRSAILSINAIIFLCLLGMAFALTTIQPIYLMDESLPLLSVCDAVFSESDGMRVATRFIILIAGSLALVGSLYAALHANQRVLRAMLSTDTDDSTFKLFGKFGLNHLQQELRQPSHDRNEHEQRNDTKSNGRRRRRWQTCACLLFSILSGLLAGLFAIEHLINLLSIGTLFMLFALTIDIMILRCSTYLQRQLQRPQENGTVTKSTRSINLVTILLSAYCLLAATLAILIKIIILDIVTMSTTLCWIVMSVLVVGLLAIVFVLGAQPRGNAMFTMSLSHPLIAATVLFACIYLFTAVDVTAWIRIVIWMTIGFIFYFCVRKLKKPQTSSNGVINNGFYAENDLNGRFSHGSVTNSVQSLKLDNTKVNNQDATILNHQPNYTVPKANELSVSERENVVIEMEEVTKAEEYKASPYVAFTDVTSQTPPEAVVPRKPLEYLDLSKLNEIASVEDIRHLCVERREPNGTAYFVEVAPIQSPTKKEVKEDELMTKSADCSPEIDNEILAKNIVNRVLHQSDTELERRPNPEPLSLFVFPVPGEFDDYESEEEEKEVRAIVHATNERTSPFPQSMSRGTSPSVIRTIDSPAVIRRNNSPGVIRPIDSPERQTNSLRAPNFQIGMYEALPKQKLLYDNDTERVAFKRRLESLFSQNDEPASLSAKSNFNSPIVPHSLRVKTLNHSKSAPESLLDVVIVNDTAPSRAESDVPIPPAFNQELYDTVALRNKRKAFSSVSDVIDINSTINDQQPSESVNKTGHLSRTKAHENLTELATDSDDVPAIKRKLEEIFSKGQIRPNETMDLDTQNNNENIRRSKRLEPFDTVRKQKMLFSDVLKSIGPDIHANLHPTNTTAAIDIQEAQRRESLD